MVIKMNIDGVFKSLERTIIAELIFCSKGERIDAIINLEKIKFKDNQCQSLFNTIRDLALLQKEVDIVSIFQANQEVSAIEISKLSGEYTSVSLLLYHTKILIELKYKEDLIRIIDNCSMAIKAGYNADDIDEEKNGLIADLSALSIGDTAQFENIAHYKKQIEEHINSKAHIEGFSWDISDLDYWTSGIVLPRVYVIGGLKKSGKTRFLIHTIKALLKQNIPNVFLSMEMPAYEVTKLLHASYLGFNDIRFRSSSFMNQEDMIQFKSIKIDEKLFGLECKSGLKLDQVLSRVRRYAKMGFNVVMIDYLQRISHDRNKQAQELEDISIRLADSARQNNVALILLSQLNAMGEKETPNMGHLKGSGGIGEAADVIFLFDNLYRRTKKDDDKNKVDIYIEQRHGDSGLAHLWSDLGSCRFGNLAEGKLIEEYQKNGDREENIF
jgi:replicative DNA helicase